MKSWFNWRNLRRPKVHTRPLPDLPTRDAVVAAPVRLLPKKRPVWARFGRKPSPFALRPGAIEGWMKARPTRAGQDKRPARDDDRGGIGGHHR